MITYPNEADYFAFRIGVLLGVTEGRYINWVDRISVRYTSEDNILLTIYPDRLYHYVSVQIAYDRTRYHTVGETDEMLMGLINKVKNQLKIDGYIPK